MTVAELIEWLKKMPQDAEVRYHDDFYSKVEFCENVKSAAECADCVLIS